MNDASSASSALARFRHGDKWRPVQRIAAILRRADAAALRAATAEILENIRVLRDIFARTNRR
ncbi:MAG: hypothetical protein K8T25_09755 [Planctomycetia bacterium]|nr:hypothetical protein [Planctomycetia bacterium]